MLSDPAFYLVAIPAVLIFGISKGGFGGGLGIAAVPLMALVVSPATAAGIMLPPLILMDVILNWLLVPRMGVPGAAVATCMTGFSGMAVMAVIVFRQFPAFIGGRSLLKMVFMAALLFWVSTLIPLQGFLFILKVNFFFALYLG